MGFDVKIGFIEVFHFRWSYFQLCTTPAAHCVIFHCSYIGLLRWFVMTMVCYDDGLYMARPVAERNSTFTPKENVLLAENTGTEHWDARLTPKGEAQCAALRLAVDALKADNADTTLVNQVRDKKDELWATAQARAREAIEVCGRYVVDAETSDDDATHTDAALGLLSVGYYADMRETFHMCEFFWGFLCDPFAE